jgi:hypothetical protein
MGFDITIAGLPPCPSFDPTSPNVTTILTANANSHLQEYEKKKIGRDNKTNSTTGTTTNGNTVIGNLLVCNMVLIPLAIDPFGHFGPILQTFLFDTQPTTHITFTPTKPNPTLMYDTPKSHTFQGRKASSKLPTTIGNLHKHDNSMDTHTLHQHQRSTLYNNLYLPLLKPSQFISAMRDADSSTTLFLPLNPTLPFLSLMVN